MLTALVNADWDYLIVLRAIRDDLRTQLPSIADPIRRDDVLYYLEQAEDFFTKSHPYGAGYYVLEALARFKDVSGVDRIEVVGRDLCAAFLKHYPTSPPGFSRTGRMRQKPGIDVDSGGVEPFRGPYRFLFGNPDD
jgi:hypothetical protein